MFLFSNINTNVTIFAADMTLLLVLCCLCVVQFLISINFVNLEHAFLCECHRRGRSKAYVLLVLEGHGGPASVAEKTLFRQHEKPGWNTKKGPLFLFWAWLHHVTVDFVFLVWLAGLFGGWCMAGWDETPHMTIHTWFYRVFAFCAHVMAWSFACLLGSVIWFSQSGIALGKRYGQAVHCRQRLCDAVL